MVNTEKHGKTVRQKMVELLENEALTALELSQALHISEKDVVYHLPHVAKTIGHKRKLIIQPPKCLECGFSFNKRSRYSIPSRCPRCKNENISPPVFFCKDG